MIDSHAHLNDPAFRGDLAEVLARASDSGVQAMINVGYDLESSRHAVELADQYSHLWAVVGLHPHDAKLWTEELGDALQELVKHPKVLALGEVGLDYHYDNSPRDKQRSAFRAQLNLARQLNLPAVIHSREATRDTLEIVGEYPEVSCLLHCYSGSLETATIYEEMGHFFSFGGPITFQNAHKLRDVVIGIPLERILLETDCPYLTPEPYRGQRNEPAYVCEVVKKIAELKGLSYEKVAELSTRNAEEFFKIND